MKWILVLYVHAGMLSQSDSMALARVGVFSSQAECVAAGSASGDLVAGTVKALRFVCLPKAAR